MMRTDHFDPRPFFRWLRDTLRMPEPPAPGDMALAVDDHGWLVGDCVIRRPSHPSWYSADRPLKTLTRGPFGVCWHYSATDPGTALVMARRRERKRRPDDRAASWHLSIESDGSLVQMAPLIRRTWHCRVQAGRIDAGRGPVPVSWALVGVELIGYGDGYSPEQVAAAERLVRAGRDAYGWRDEDCRHEHRHFDPARRSDCGPPWSDVHLPAILGRVYG